MLIDRIYRYPVKGLTAEALEEVRLESGQALPWDRAFALAQGNASFDPAVPTWISKRHFMCLMANAKIAALRSSFDDRSGVMTLLAPDGAMLEANALSLAGRADIAAWLARFLGDEARGTPVLHLVPGHVFGDMRGKVLSLINQASLAALETAAGARRHKRRFRANIWFSGIPAWAEHGWLGRELLIGGARLKVIHRIPRCAATEVNPITAERDADPVAELRAGFGHVDLGVYAEVVEGGRIAMGDAVELI
ncbi:MAG: MOSC domain-containing protein [Acetobacteraceae bacterium]|nr:MOSC domain-containing protein [Acetobacteraceae bacterium]